MYTSLPPFTSEKPCPKCGERLHWLDAQPPEVNYNTRSGTVESVVLHRFCMGCSYTETGYLHINRDPVWTPQGARF